MRPVGFTEMIYNASMVMSEIADCFVKATKFDGTTCLFWKKVCGI